ncbi:hypothetical protein D3C87_1957860 [compost metagenome]
MVFGPSPLSLFAIREVSRARIIDLGRLMVIDAGVSFLPSTGTLANFFCSRSAISAAVASALVMKHLIQ